MSRVSAAELLAQVQSRKRPLADDLVSPMLRFLEVNREVCGDLDKALILLSIAARSAADPRLSQITDEERLAGAIPLFPTRGVNARSIAETSGLPRETVRRKILELVEAGWIARDGPNLHFTREGYAASTPARTALEMVAVQFYRAVAQRLQP